MPSLRVLFDLPGSGTWNMAVDEALLESAANSGEATLRFYAWEVPTLSLGYFQAARDRELHGASGVCPLVRRSTGGGAILHDRELTYSLVVPHQATAAAARRLYEVVHLSLIAQLGKTGVPAALHGSGEHCERANASEAEPFLCFQRRTCFDVVCSDAKIAGSAQRRRGKAVLQHGSILLSQSAWAPELPGIAELTGHSLAAEDLARSWASPVGVALGHTVAIGKLTDEERAAAARFEATRFGSPEYVLRRE